jgi:hypothetical protein
MRSCIPLQNRLGEIHDALHMLNSRQREQEEVEQSRVPKRRRDCSPSPPDTTTPLSNMLQPQVKLHQLKYNQHRHQPKSLMDQLHVAELRSYNKRCTHYFMNLN